MSVLDDLKKEAAGVQARAEHERSADDAERDAILKAIRPRMQALYAFLKEFVESLSVVEPDVRCGYAIPGFGEIQGLRQGQYRLTSPDTRVLSQFTLHFQCLSEGSVKFEVHGKEAAEHQRQTMWQHNLRFTSKSLTDDTGIFFLETFVPVSFEFMVDVERAAIRVRARNISVLGTDVIYLSPDQMSDEFFDEIAKQVLRKPSRFFEMSGNRLSDEARKRLRQQLAHDNLKKLAEQETGPETPPAPGRRKGLLKGLFRLGREV